MTKPHKPKPPLSKTLKKIGRLRPDAPIGVLDIGSNSIRLVAYSGSARTPVPIYNERAFCKLGASVAKTGYIKGKPYTLALRTLRRFRAMADRLGIEKMTPFATAAIRDAKNGVEFLSEIEAILNMPVRVLSGEEEASFSADGVMLAIPDADGVIADLGGGSLELALVKDNKLIDSTTLPLGVLTLKTKGEGSKEKIRSLIKSAFDEIGWLKHGWQKQLYLVGGTWRNLAQIHMQHIDYPLDVLHHYEMRTRGLDGFSKAIAALSDTQSRKFTYIPSNRRPAIPIAAILLRHMVKRLAPEQIIISATGVREGIVYTMLDEKHRKADALLIACEEMAERMSKSTIYGHELINWTQNLFINQRLGKQVDRYRQAACLVSDISWAQHPAARAETASLAVLKAPFTGITHAGRIFMAYALSYRHDYERGRKYIPKLPAADKDMIAMGQALGLAFRLAHSLSASLPGLLPQTRLAHKDGTIILDISAIPKPFYAPIITKRLENLATALKAKAHIKQN